MKEGCGNETGRLYLHRSAQNQAAWYNFCQGGHKQLHCSVEELAQISNEVDFLQPDSFKIARYQRA
jgi:hypothetical protein